MDDPSQPEIQTVVGYVLITYTFTYTFTGKALSHYDLLIYTFTGKALSHYGSTSAPQRPTLVVAVHVLDQQKTSL